MILLITVRWQKLLGSTRGGSTALSYRNCVITPGWRLMRTWYRTCFHALYEEKKKIWRNMLQWYEEMEYIYLTRIQRNMLQGYEEIELIYVTRKKKGIQKEDIKLPTLNRITYLITLWQDTDTPSYIVSADLSLFLPSWLGQ